MNKASLIISVFSLAGILSCTSGQKAETAEADTTQADAPVSYASEDGLFSFAIDPSTAKSDVDEAIMDGFLKAFAEFHSGDDSMNVSDKKLIRRTFFSAQSCVPASIIELRLDVPKEGTTVMHWYVITELPQEFIVSEPLTEDVTERQGTSDAALDLGYFLDTDCPTVVIRTNSEGGDIDYSISEAVTFYAVNRGFTEILHLELERTTKEGYYNNPDSAKVTSKKRSFELVQSQNETPNDIVAKFDDGSGEKIERYSWNGQIYQLKE